jgi:hypothetical protein
MRKKSLRWLRWPLIFGTSAVAGWALTSAVVQRRISAVWQDFPTRRVSMYPSSLGQGVEARVSTMSKRGSLDDLAAWLAELAAETSPDRLRAALDVVPGLPETWGMLAAETALARFADIDPRAALDYALLRLGDGSAAWNALANVLRSRAADDQESLRRYLPAVARQLTHGQGGVATLAALNPEESLAFIQRWQLPLDHPGVQECIRGAIRKIAKTDPMRALQTVEKFGVRIDGFGRGSPEMMVQAWAREAPEAALEWIQQHSGNPNDPFATITRGGYLEGIAMGGIAQRDPQRVMDWFASRTAVPHRWNSVEWMALQGLRKANPEGATRVLETMVPADQQAAAAAGALDPWGASPFGSDAKAAIAWVASWPPEWRTSSPPSGEADATLSDGDFKQWLALGVKLSPAAEARIADQVELNPEGALTEFRSASSAVQRSALSGVIAGLVNSEPTTAAALLDELPRGEAWAKAALQLATEWSRFDRTTADTWINTLPAGTAQRLRTQVTEGRIIR